MFGMFILRNRIPIPEPDTLRWGRWMELHREDRIVAQVQVGPFFVSTVFLGLDHGFCSPTPVLFETMVFAGPKGRDLAQDRYSSWEQAEEGHRRMVAHYEARIASKNRKRTTA